MNFHSEPHLHAHLPLRAEKKQKGGGSFRDARRIKGKVVNLQQSEQKVKSEDQGFREISPQQEKQSAQKVKTIANQALSLFRKWGIEG